MILAACYYDITMMLSIILLRHYELFEVIRDIMMEPKLADNLSNIAECYQELTIGDRRCFSELNNGEWWKKEEERVRVSHGVDACILPVIIHIDGTNLDVTSKHSAEPITITLGNFSIALRVRIVFRMLIL